MAGLARIDLTPAELDRLAGELDVIVESVARVSEIATPDVPATSHPLPLTNVFRPDVPVEPVDRALRARVRAGAHRRQVRGPADPGGGRDDADLTRSPPPPRREARREGGVQRRGDAGAPRPDRRRRRTRCTRSCTSAATPRSPRPPTSTRAAPPGSRCTRSPACRSPSRTSSSPRAWRRPPGSKILEGWIPPYDATLVEKLKAAGPADPGQDQHGRVRHGLVHRALRVRQHAQPVGPRPHPRRLRRRLRRGGRRLRGAAGHRHGHRRLDPPARAPSPARSASSPPTAGCPATGSSRWRRRSTRPVPSRARSWTRRCCTSSSAATTRATRRRSTSRCPRSSPPPAQGATGDLTGVRVGVIRELQGEGYQPGVLARFEESLELLRGAGAEIVEVSCPHFTYALAAYYLILPGGGVQQPRQVRRHALRPARRARRTTRPPSASCPPRAARASATRSSAAIILGTYALSAGYYDAYYGSAQKVRTLIQRDFTAAFEQADVLVSPTAPTTAFKLGEKLDDPLAMYLNDVATIPANLAGVPGHVAAERACPTTACRSGSRSWPRPRPTTGCTASAPRSRRCWRTTWGGPLLLKAPELEVGPMSTLVRLRRRRRAATTRSSASRCTSSWARGPRCSTARRPGSARSRTPRSRPCSLGPAGRAARGQRRRPSSTRSASAWR